MFETQLDPAYKGMTFSLSHKLSHCKTQQRKKLEQSLSIQLTVEMFWKH